jgi:hypothetical protein
MASVMFHETSDMVHDPRSSKSEAIRVDRSEADFLSGSSTVFERLQGTTLDQLRSLVYAFENRSIRQAAKALGREQASVGKQLDALDKRFGSEGPTRQHLFLKPSRGGELAFTRTGELVVELARTVLAAARDSDLALRRAAAEVKVGAPTFMVPLLMDTWNRWTAEVHDLHLATLHASSGGIPAVLEEDLSMDFCFGGCMVLPDEPAVFDPPYQYCEYKRESICILTNLPENRLVGPISADQLRSRELDFVLPKHGPIAEFAEALYGPDQKGLKVLEEAQHVFFVISSLKYSIYKGNMFATETISKWAEHFWTGDHSAPSHLRTVEIVQDPTVPMMSVGLFRRAADETYPEDHPLQRCWNTFTEICNGQNAGS